MKGTFIKRAIAAVAAVPMFAAGLLLPLTANAATPAQADIPAVC